jgi:hypothetical protein
MAAIRQEELRWLDQDALVVAFPTELVRRRAARQQRAVFIRRRIAAGAVAGMLVIGGFGLLTGTAAGPVASAPGAPKSVTLTAGTTLWGIAQQHAEPGTDPRAYVAALLELNGLEAPPPQGTRIKLPRSS